MQTTQPVKKEKKSKYFSMIIEPSLLKEAQKFAWSQNLSLASVVRAAMRQYITSTTKQEEAK